MEIAAEQDDAPAWEPAEEVHTIPGVPAAPGMAIGPVCQLQTTRIQVADHPVDGPAAEKARLRRAVEAATEQLGELHASVEARSGREEAMIFLAHQALILDPGLHAEVEGEIDAGHGAAWAWQRAIEIRAVQVGSADDEHLAARATDLHDVGQRVLALLAGTAHGEARLPDHPVILVADDLTPSHAARLDPRRILGLCTARGGPTSHTAILARARGIPAIVGAGPAVLEQPDGTPAILDGAAGRLYLHPAPADLDSARSFRAAASRRRANDEAMRLASGRLRDGHRVEVAANVGGVAEAERAVEAGAEGIGLVRSEFLFLDRETAPSEAEQYAAYSAMARALDGRPLVVRTLDAGGDKRLPYLDLPAEENPFLGIRGIRLCLRRRDLFVPQLRAIHRAAAHGRVRILLPMVATVEEVRAAKAMAEEVRAELGVAPLPLGVMVEVPSAVMMAQALAREVDFFSIGTNDLTQYVLAMDRLDPRLGAEADALHPAVLRMIEMTVRAAAETGRPVGVCGGLAGDVLGAVILAGLGVTELSMPLPAIASVKAALRRCTLPEARRLARLALSRDTAAEVRALEPP